MGIALGKDIDDALADAAIATGDDDNLAGEIQISTGVVIQI